MTRQIPQTPNKPHRAAACLHFSHTRRTAALCVSAFYTPRTARARRFASHAPLCRFPHAATQRVSTRRVRSEDTPRRRSEDTPLRGVREAKTCRCAAAHHARHAAAPRVVRYRGWGSAASSAHVTDQRETINCAQAMHTPRERNPPPHALPSRKMYLWRSPSGWPVACHARLAMMTPVACRPII
jgi:hypothetical protein